MVLDYRETDVVAEVKRLTGGGADAAIEALGTQEHSRRRCGVFALGNIIESWRLFGQIAHPL